MRSYVSWPLNWYTGSETFAYKREYWRGPVVALAVNVGRDICKRALEHVAIGVKFILSRRPRVQSVDV